MNFLNAILGIRKVKDININFWLHHHMSNPTR
jgi:hypothetical protein